ncbi:unnamed protein product (mitochondrion) [Plasmodiophora brassicae]|uniref:R3H domain-containing protein n=1 Tax=Plasmodiophora brassicae TaxID=37360 RepID=A0A3P3Y4G1_PLABS|nr:unnamed protein product [Plasmodiophora brassicae]
MRLHPPRVTDMGDDPEGRPAAHGDIDPILVEAFLRDPNQDRVMFPPMSSYHRLLLHKVADLYRIEHPSLRTPDGQRHLVLVKLDQSSIPDLRLCDLAVPPAAPANATSAGAVAPAPVRIMRRQPGPSASGVPSSASRTGSTGDAAVDTSLQTREEAYARARAKLFNLDDGAADDDDDDDGRADLYDDGDEDLPVVDDEDQDLYRRNVVPFRSVSSGYAPPVPPYEAAGPYWPPSSSMPRQAAAAAGPYAPLQADQLFINESVVDVDTDWAEQKRPDADSFTFCTSMLEVYDLPVGARNYQIDMLLDDLKQRPCTLRWLSDGRVIAVFGSARAALDAMQSTSSATYKLRPWSGGT